MSKNTLPALPLSITDLVDEYNQKVATIPQLVEQLTTAYSAIEKCSYVCGTFGGRAIDYLSLPSVDSIKIILRRSAWTAVYKKGGLAHLLTKAEQEAFERSLNNPPDFTLENVYSSFKNQLMDPRQCILKTFAEVFCTLDNSYKSHSKVKVGVKGLPKRIILPSSYNGNAPNLAPVLNALSMVGVGEMQDRYTLDEKLKDGTLTVPGLTFKTFANGNVHIMFDAKTCVLINKCLAEYYGDVLPDAEDEKGTDHRKQSTNVSKDLQFYPTPNDAASTLIGNVVRTYGKEASITVLEPSAGNGNLIRKLKEKVPNAQVVGYEVHNGRAHECRDQGFNVLTANFLEITPIAEFDCVIMNPPFAGRHYIKHINHAIKFLKPGGVLYSILPATAWYDNASALPHDNIKGWRKPWRDLPVGSFSESGTNVNTGIWQYVKP